MEKTTSGSASYVTKRGRERGQNGHLAVVGKRQKKWQARYRVYERLPDGTERSKLKFVILGPRAEMTRKQAADSLRAIIASETEGAKVVKADLTFGQFWNERFLPMKRPRWKSSSRATQIDNISRYCVDFLKDMPLREIDRFQLQMIANRLAGKYSKSVVAKFITWSRAILEEAVEDGFISRNPARKLEAPETRPENKRFLTLEEISDVLRRLPVREQLILQISMVLGLRPCELFALRWDDVQGHSLRLDEETLDGKMYPSLKTKNSKGFVALPASLRKGLSEWRLQTCPQWDDEFIFPSATGGVLRLDNYRADVLRPLLNAIAEETGITGIDFRACRRTCATHLSKHGNVKEVQAHLRHSKATTTLDVYIQEIPSEVRAAVESLDSSLNTEAPSTRPSKRAKPVFRTK